MTFRGRWYLRIHPLIARVDSRIRPEWVVNRASLSNIYNYCYFRLPKCANSTVIKTLISHDFSFYGYDVNDSIKLLKRSFPNLLHARALSLKGFVERYRTFAFVRNPYVRVLSAYLDKIVNADKGQYSYVARALRLPETNQASFSQFISFLQQNGLYKNPHWAPQRLLLPLDVDKLTWLGTVENIYNDLHRIIDGIWGAGAYENVFSREDRRQGANEKLALYYTEDLAQKVYELYQDDFYAFGYSKDLNPESSSK